VTEDPQNGPWLEIAVEVAGIDAEVAADLLRQACPGGVAIETPSRFDRATDTYVADGDAPSLVKGYLRPGPDSERVVRNAQLALQTAPLQRPPQWRDARELPEADWRDAWKKYFGVLKIGRGLVVAPTWVEHKARDGETVIRIDPGMAFGTGQHPTTAMCLAALEQAVSGGESVLDLGCGSGILAIAAARLGAGRVAAIDIDPQAIKATRENAAANGVESLIEARAGTLAPADSAGRPEAFDVIVANISGLTLGRLAPSIVACLAPSGMLIASGFLEDSVADLRSAFADAGLTVERTVEDGVWRALIARRAGV
jgi:ribosomal protein L11 methyltransferase